MGRRGGTAAKTRRIKDPMKQVRDALPDLLGDLMKAARGLAPFDTLPPDKRLAALFRVIEYGAGKPVGRDKAETNGSGSNEDPVAEPEALNIE